MTDFEPGVPRLHQIRDKLDSPVAYGWTLSILGAVALTLLVVASITENGWIAWAGLLTGGAAVGFMIGCDPR